MQTTCRTADKHNATKQLNPDKTSMVASIKKNALKKIMKFSIITL